MCIRDRCKIVDEDGNTVAPGIQGELCTRGYSVMLGYWDEPEKTADSIDSDGWMHSGDLAVFDEEGYGNITGRVKDMIIRGGENAYPAEIESFLYRHPAVQEVQVFGVPDQKFGEQIACWIILKEARALRKKTSENSAGARSPTTKSPTMCASRQNCR